MRLRYLCLLLQVDAGTDWLLVLGLDNAEPARKLVRLLLADPLVPREGWEEILESYDSDPARGLLIRYVRLIRWGVDVAFFDKG